MPDGISPPFLYLLYKNMPFKHVFTRGWCRMQTAGTLARALGSTKKKNRGAMEEEEDMPYPLLVEAVSYEAWGDNLKELTRLGFDIRAPEGGRFKPRVHILTIRTCVCNTLP